MGGLGSVTRAHKAVHSKGTRSPHPPAVWTQICPSTGAAPKFSRTEEEAGAERGASLTRVDIYGPAGRQRTRCRPRLRHRVVTYWKRLPRDLARRQAAQGPRLCWPLCSTVHARELDLALPRQCPPRLRQGAMVRGVRLPTVQEEAAGPFGHTAVLGAPVKSLIRQSRVPALPRAPLALWPPAPVARQPQGCWGGSSLDPTFDHQVMLTLNQAKSKFI